MKTLILFLLTVLPVVASAQNKIALVIHGGAGTILKENMSPEKEAAYQAKLTEALNAGYAVLERGGSSLDAVTTTIQILEQSPLFNAGKGAVFTAEGRNELDASIMDGKTGMAGAVAGVNRIQSPILAAQAVMQHSPHVMLTGAGAEEFAQAQGLDMVDPNYFFDQTRYDQLKRIQAREAQKSKEKGYVAPANPDEKFGTVGCVALDKQGNIVAGTSTGGMTNKRWNRVGDSPIIGAGTYASNQTCGVSATGHGEFFIRNVVAYDIAARMQYANMSLEEAANSVINEKLKSQGGEGGIVALDKNGNIAMPFNTPGMYRGYRKEGEKAKVFIYKE
jgi:beta-aspartyl-peptidase (threonine type)